MAQSGESNNTTYAVILFLLALAGIIYFYAQPQHQAPLQQKNYTDWHPQYYSARVAANISDDYLLSNQEFDYKGTNIETLAAELANDTDSAEQTITKILDYTYEHLEYDPTEPDEVCFSYGASYLVNRTTGQCDTQSIVIIALLRAQGIAARPVAGCLYVDNACYQSAQSTYPTIRIPKIKSVANNTLSRAGGLHAWVEAWTPSKGWISIESTTGQVVQTNSCSKYNIEVYPGNRQEICVAQSLSYANWCRDWNGRY